jgi:hypothetical protein
MVASLIACLALPTSRGGDDAPARSQLRVVVTDPDGAPVAATVQAGESPTLTTDARGAVELNLPVGWMTVDVEARGFLRDRVPGVAIVSSETRTLTVPLRRAAALRGVVLDERGEPREGAVAFVRVASGERVQVRSDAAGRFALLDALAPGPARLLFSSAEPTPLAAALDLAVPLEGLDVVVSLAPCPTLAGRVVAAGGPVEHASLICRDAPHTQGEVHVDAEGRLTAPAALALGPWTYELRLQAPSGLVTIAPIDLAAAATGRVFVAGGECALEGVVRDEDGAPLALAPLALFVDAGDRRARSTAQRSDARGRFAFEGLPAGRAVVYAHPDARGGFALLDLTGPRAQVDLRAPRRALITAQVRDADGAPVIGVPLLAVPDEPLLERLPLDDRGEARASSGARFGLPHGWAGRVEADPRALEVVARTRGARRAVLAPARVADLEGDLSLTLVLHLERPGH